ncbi:hypothetical protein KL930_000333 [Ogataea haglerorum]|uniref:Uncharacterized protein n=1 Tax=Ogataea haglerorum TaxID=1937702 RepID=A0AAN6D4R0_9ASCO|nr:uncharacterized protein KL911_000798 [Ogataea haglerorum]KAG7697612.1 hypothetical protein KL951_002186 [Ogataea haglerorum]KAG7701213.1 hypothetical protein KL915_000244 [Ogataea haglerorum]KAG7705880.1 hypothetical protein KL950_003456 [Ogataea haglerorum]KAG7709171.1 hypothetical protein KL914_001561 [Ogataea haglerorum]KAG7715299.1 hypothetical protein KL913_004131 [Ogataea haglerorum]
MSVNRSRLHEISNSPVPAWAFTAGLLATNAIKPPIEVQLAAASRAQTSRLLPAILKPSKPISPYPNGVHTLLFGSFIGLGGFMCYDNDPINGSGLISAWSFLYCLANSRRAIWSWKLYPKFLLAGAGLNSVIYGGRFFGFY